MITVHPQRVRPQDRIPSESQKPVVEQVATFPAPVAGWVTNESMVAQRPDSAFVLDNFWPTATAIQPRGGYEARVDVAGDIGFMIEYAAGAEYFVADGTALYDFTDATANGTTLSSVVTGLTSSVWVGVETQNSGGSFLTLVNGTDNLHLYDGTTWYTVTDVSATHSITGGLDTADISYAWNYNNRTYFVEKDTMNAWYLGTNSVSGAATQFSLAGVFNKGGNLHSGATYSSDSGSGMDDRIVFLTTKGEIALYSGDPASTFSLIGVYDVGRPISTDPFIKVGGDVLIATEAGLIPVSGAVQKGPAQLELVSVSRPIEREWEYWVGIQESGWKCLKVASKSMALFAVPSTEEPFCFVLNLETGAWARWTNWDIDAMADLGGSLHIANGSDVYLGDAGGLDGASLFVCKMCSGFQLGDRPTFKAAKRVRGAFRRDISFIPQFSAASDYKTNFPSAPNSAATVSVSGEAIWDASDWDVTSWGSYGRQKGAITKWHVVNAHGYSLATQLQITSAESAKIDCELVSYDMTYTEGDT